MITLSRLLISVIMMVVGAAQPEPDVMIFQQDFSRLRATQMGAKTNLAEVERVGNELLERYSSPSHREAISYQMAHIYAQSGGQSPGRLIALVQAALKFQLSPPQRARLYVYWGDAIRISKPPKPEEQRREAARVYLNGIKEILTLKLPDENIAQLPGVNPFNVDGGGEVAEQLRKEHIAAVEARERAVLQREMFQHRDVLSKQLIALYTHKPSPSEELKGLAESILNDPEAVERLMSRLPKEVEKADRIAAVVEQKNVEAKSVAEQSNDGSWTRLRVMGLISLVVLATLAVVIYRKRS